MSYEPHEVLPGVVVRGPMRPGYERVLSQDALAFVVDLARTFRPRVDEVLARRRDAQAEYDAGELPHFLDETKQVRESDWTVAPLPDDLLERRVEITGPTDRKMIINALNSGASVFMADFEDANTPTWDNLVQGQFNVADAVRRTITFDDPESGKAYRLKDRTAVLMVRPRGWHLPEKHVEVDGRPIPGSLFDFGLAFFHNAKELLARGSGPYYYLPKMQDYREARLWNDVFVHAQTKLGIPVGSIRATCLIETLPAAFQMDEFMYELRDHSAGLNCGRWDYIFSFIKTRRADPHATLPDRSQVGMAHPFMRAYTQLLIKTCHRRRASAMGGMAAYIPVRADADANERALEAVRADKMREVGDGHDGTWVAHPGLVPIAREIFDAHMSGPNQLDRLREEFHTTPEQLLAVPTGTRTEAGFRWNIRVGVQYLEAWLRGVGCVPLYNLMEDAATSEISRAQLWQWIHHGAKLEDGRTCTPELFRSLLASEMESVREEVGPARFDAGRFADATALFEELTLNAQLADFLTLPAYDVLTAPAGATRG